MLMSFQWLESLSRFLSEGIELQRLEVDSPWAYLKWFSFAKALTMSDIPNCPTCDSELTYEDDIHFVCPECAHEWPMVANEASEEALCIKDANGVALVDGDTVTVIKDLKVKGTSSTLKVGTKVKNIRLVEGDHDIDCKVSGIGMMKLKSEFVKKC